MTTSAGDGAVEQTVLLARADGGESSPVSGDDAMKLLEVMCRLILPMVGDEAMILVEAWR